MNTLVPEPEIPSHQGPDAQSVDPDLDVVTMAVKFHLMMDTIDRLPQTGEKGIHLKQQLKDKLIEHKQYIDTFGQDLPEIRNWKWKG